jgi:hypothetical protein
LPTTHTAKAVLRTLAIKIYKHLTFIARTTPGFLQRLSDWRIIRVSSPQAQPRNTFDTNFHCLRKLRTRRSFQDSHRSGHSSATAPPMSTTASAATRKLPHRSLKSAQCCSILPSPTPRRMLSFRQGLPPAHGIALQSRVRHFGRFPTIRRARFNPVAVRRSSPTVGRITSHPLPYEEGSPRRL